MLRGAELAFTFQGEALEKRVRPLAAETWAPMWSAIATSPTPRRSTRYSRKPESCGARLDFVVHCIAFSDKDELTGRYVDTSEDNFTKSLRSPAIPSPPSPSAPRS